MGGVTNTIGQGLGTVFTGGLNKAVGGPFKRVGDVVGGGLTLNSDMAMRGLTGKYGSPGGGGNGLSQQSPMDILVNTGGAPLLANIAMGANPTDTMASFLGIPVTGLQSIIANPNDPNLLQNTGVDPKTASQIKSLYNQLVEVQSNTNLKNKAIQSLVSDFPNFMAQNVPKYASIMDEQTKAMMDSALSQVGAKFAANGQLSSGATAEAAARAGADIGMQRVNYGTALAGQDWQNQFNEANALRSFQMNMMGQNAQNGFNAVQNALAGNQQVNMANANFSNQMQLQQHQDQNAMFGALGGLAGTALGGYFQGLGMAPRLNTNQTVANRPPRMVSDYGYGIGGSYNV